MDTQERHAIETHAIQVGRLAEAIEHLADVIGRQNVAAAQAPAAPGGPPQGRSGPPGGNSGPSVEEKMSKKVFAICKTQGWDIRDIGERATGRDLGADSRTWSKEDLIAVLDAIKDWGF